MKTLIRQLLPATLAILSLTFLLGVVYPLAVTAVGQVAFNDRANGSIVKVDGVAVGSELLGQNFTAPGYFHPRPSAAGDGYDGSASSGSNLGPSNPNFLDSVASRVDAYRKENGLSADAQVPVDAVTASASGLDPQISVANALVQAPRVAAARDLDLDTVLTAIGQHTSHRPLGVLGDEGVNVLQLNLALDRMG
jgi:K+-transporting ATPase ATPase C chain